MGEGLSHTQRLELYKELNESEKKIVDAIDIKLSKQRKQSALWRQKFDETQECMMSILQKVSTANEIDNVNYRHLSEMLIEIKDGEKACANEVKFRISETKEDVKKLQESFYDFRNNMKEWYWFTKSGRKIKPFWLFMITFVIGFFNGVVWLLYNWESVIKKISIL